MSNTGRDPAAADIFLSSKGPVSQALDLMIKALDLLDEGGGPQDVGAQLDLAIHRLRDWVEQNSTK